MKALSIKNKFLALLFLVVISLTKTSFAAPVPSVNISGLQTENFVGEQFCFTATFINTGDTGFSPYFQLFLKPDFQFASADLFGLSANATLVGSLPGITNDPISGQPVSGENGANFYTLELPIGSVGTGGAPLNTNICIDVAANATPDVPQVNALQITPVFANGDSATGSVAVTGSTQSNMLTPTIITTDIQDATAEGESAPGPAFTYDVELIADIASDLTVSNISFPQVDINTNRQFVGPISAVGGSGCSAVVTNSSGQVQTGALPFSPTHMNSPGGTVDVTCNSGTGTIGSASDIVISIPIYVVDILADSSCAFESNGIRTTGKHMVLRKSADTTSISPGDTITYTLSFAVSEYVSGTQNVNIVDVMPDGLSYTGVQSMSINGSPVSITPNIVNNSPSGGQTTVTYDITAAYGAGLNPTDTGIIRYTAVVDELYNNAEPVRANDLLTNDAVINFDVINGGATNCTDDSSQTVSVIPMSVSKTLLNPQAEYTPGQIVSWRIRLDVPSGDTKNIVFNDYFPLPVLDATTLSTNTNLASNPDISLGPNDTLGLTPTSITTDAASNGLSITWPDVNSTTPRVIEVEISSMVISTDPYGDDLFLTNVFEAKTQNSDNTENLLYAGVNFNVRAPELAIEKSVSPASNVDAGDTVSYSISVTNNGGASAYDVIVRDELPSNVSSCTINSQPSGSGDLFNATGYTMSGTLAVGAVSNFSFDCIVDYSVEINNVHRNTAYVSWASAAGATPFPEINDVADFSTAPVKPQKSIVSTSKTHTTEAATDVANNPRLVSIGETVRYRLVTELPEGTANTATIRDYLPGGQQYVVGSGRVALVSDSGMTSSFVCTSGTGLMVTGNTATVTPTCGIDANGTTFNSGTDPRFALGNLVNNDSDTDGEYIIIEFDALVMNHSVNQQGRRVNNRFRPSFNGNDFSFSNRVYTRIVEPQLTVTPTITLTDLDKATIVLDIENTGLAHAFQVVGDDGNPWSLTMPSGLISIGNLKVNVTGNVYENGTSTLISAADFSVAGSQSEILSALKTMQFDPGAKLNISFDAQIIPNAAPSASQSLSVFEYASQETGDVTNDVRTSSSLTSGTGNSPITATSPLNDYRTETEFDFYAVSGFVYQDLNVDTTFNNSEPGIEGVVVTLHNTTLDTCQSTRTNADGYYAFFPVPSGSYQIIESSLETVPIPGACPPAAADKNGFTSTTSNILSATVSNNSLSNQNFGDLKEPTFSPDHSGTVLPGNVVYYAHRFQAYSAGTLTFTSNNSASTTPGWSNVLYQDSDCNGSLDGAEGNAPIANNITTSAGTDICLINKVLAPANVQNGEAWTNTLTANFDTGNALAGVINLVVTDYTKAAANNELGASRLELKKTVQTYRGAPLVAVSAETETQNQAKPGDVLKYRIYYRNSGTGPLTDLVINDVVPAFTTLSGSPICEAPLPDSLTSCTPQVNGENLKWLFPANDVLQGGNEGVVSYEVLIE